MQTSEFLKGAVAGCVATLPMTGAMKGVTPFLPPQDTYRFPPRKVTAQAGSRIGLWQQTDQRERSLMTYLAHFGFGAAVGSLYAPLAARVPVPPLLSGVAYGLAVWTAGYVGGLPALSIVPPPPRQSRSRNVQLILSHIVWGASLGLLVDRMDAW